MKQSLFLLFLLLHFYKGNAQKQQISVSTGICFNGTGDSKGIIYSTEYSKYIKKSKYFWSASFGGTIHGGSYPIIYEYPVGKMNDGSVNYTIAGLQASFHIGKNFLNKKGKELYFKIGPVIRFQSSSYWDKMTVLYPAFTGLSYPVVLFENITPRRTIAIGASPIIGYSFPIGKGFNLGFAGSFQFDTQGDNLSSLVLKLGKNF